MYFYSIGITKAGDRGSDRVWRAPQLPTYQKGHVSKRVTSQAKIDELPIASTQSQAAAIRRTSSMQDQNMLQLRLLEAAFNQSMSSIVITDAEFEKDGPHVLFCNDAFCQMTGYEQAELVGKNLRILQGPKTDRALIDKLRQCLHTGEFFHGRTINYRKDSSPYVVEWNISAVYDDNGDICNYVSVQSNLTAQVTAQQQRDILAQALHVTHDCVLVTDEAGKLVFFNNSFERLTGLKESDVLGKHHRLLLTAQRRLPSATDPSLSEEHSLTETLQNCYATRRSDGTTAYLIIDISKIKSFDGLSDSSVFIGKDVTDQILERDRLQLLAQTDDLTRLLNRRAGEIVLDQAISRATTARIPFSTVLCDIDHFKAINDNFGHIAGDQVLIDVASLLNKAVRHGDYCIRWGGEEFLILLPGCPLDAAARLAERIRLRMMEVSLGPTQSVTASLGVAEWEAGDSGLDLIGRVDEALYAAKNAGRNQVMVADATGNTPYRF